MAYLDIEGPKERLDHLDKLESQVEEESLVLLSREKMEMMAYLGIQDLQDCLDQWVFLGSMESKELKEKLFMGHLEFLAEMVNGVSLVRMVIEEKWDIQE